jgi:hypothetical protein
MKKYIVGMFALLSGVQAGNLLSHLWDPFWHAAARDATQNLSWNHIWYTYCEPTAQLLASSPFIDLPHVTVNLLPHHGPYVSLPQPPLPPMPQIDLGPQITNSLYFGGMVLVAILAATARRIL